MRVLHFTTGSPFARAVRIILDEIGLDWERREEITTPTVEERARAAPTLQVPSLRDRGRVLWESGLIAEYLMSEYPERPAAAPPLATHFARPANQWHDRLVFATIQTLGTAATTISQMTWSGVCHGENSHLARCAGRLPHLLSWLDEQIESDGGGFFEGELSAQDIFLACHLDFIANRPLDLEPRTDRYSRIDALMERIRQRPTFSANPVLWWDPGVVGYAEDNRPIYRS